MNRILNVVRLHFVNRYAVLGLPWLILGIAFAITLLVWVLVRSIGGEIEPVTIISGAGFSIVVYLLIYAALAITTTFPFALGFSVTRRDFYLGTALTLLILSAGFSAVIVVLSYIEEATHGWGLNGQIFVVPGLGGGGPFGRWAIYTLLMMFFSAVGMAVATVYMRWRMSGMLVFWTLVALLAIGVLALIAYTKSWTLVGQWFVTNGAIGVALWTLVPSVLAAGAGFFVLRRATPKN